MKLVICGDSHTECLVWARSVIEREDPDAVRHVSVGPFGNGRYLGQPFFSVSDDTIKFDREDYAANYELLSGGPLRRRDDIMHGFSMGFHTAPLFRQLIWRTHLPWRIWHGGDTLPVSDNCLIAMADHIWRYMRAFYEAAIRQKINFFVICAPPPRRTHLCISQGTAERTVIEVDRIFRQSVAKWLTDRRIQYIPPPAATMDADGFMLRQYEPLELARDFHHGNGAYGVLMLREILARIDLTSKPGL